MTNPVPSDGVQSVNHQPCPKRQPSALLHNHGSSSHGDRHSAGTRTASESDSRNPVVPKSRVPKSRVPKPRSTRARSLVTLPVPVTGPSSVRADSPDPLHAADGSTRGDPQKPVECPTKW